MAVPDQPGPLRARRVRERRRELPRPRVVAVENFVYIEGFYNPKRPHSANSNLSPDKKEDMFKKHTTPIS